MHDPLCNLASENFFLCLAKYGQFQIQTPSVTDFAADIVGMYLSGGCGRHAGKVLARRRGGTGSATAAGANSLMALDEVSAIKTLAAGQRVPHASKTIKTDTKVGSYYLTCDDQGQKTTGRVVSDRKRRRGRHRRPSSIGARVAASTNPLDYTAPRVE